MNVTVNELQTFQDCKVILRLTDGEMMTARILFVDLEYEDIVVDVLSTNNQQQYKGPEGAVYAVKATDIVSVEKVRT